MQRSVWRCGPPCPGVLVAAPALALMPGLLLRPLSQPGWRPHGPVPLGLLAGWPGRCLRTLLRPWAAHRLLAAAAAAATTAAAAATAAARAGRSRRRMRCCRGRRCALTNLVTLRTVRVRPTACCARLSPGGGRHQQGGCDAAGRHAGHCADRGPTRKHSQPIHGLQEGKFAALRCNAHPEQVSRGKKSTLAPTPPLKHYDPRQIVRTACV